MEEKLVLTQEWDKSFPQSDKVEHSKVTFHNRYGITLAADIYKPKDAEGRLAAIAVCGPFGAVKEQAAGLYAQTMAERGFLTMAFDPSFTGESGGQPRYMASPDINTEDFQAAVDYLSLREDVDPEKIGIIGICGWGGMALNAQRTKDYQNGSYALAGGVAEEVPEDAPFYVKDYHDYYKTRRGYHPRSLNSNGGWNVTGTMSFMNQPILRYSSEIRSAVLIIHGEKAHSCYFSRDAYAAMTEGNPNPENKELLIIPGAVHTDLYDKLDVIPFDKMAEFFRKAMRQQE
ncbi:MAG TPA: alpha/beta hydrolase [Candidatus Enterocloster excrementigallinarum]|uniref:Alpha/beta hydrolase n=1 Tax=Candidatus Enterocloster excrementigallinarum TaxID=2838558 RepID=A0A9D2TG76_9FIRM|nr:alpha/beta hydrolase [Candidatus Enterocloster excrementigallinarum]